jgi:NAD(P)H-hydrate repair Nnr-like enzyme with NAD(P)H-hydrate epimerase domain
MSQALFYTKSGLMFPGFTLEQVQKVRRALVEDFGLSELQMAESAAFSLAMVLRYSLGLSSAEAQIAMVVGNGFGSLVALAAARQMQNAGSKVNLVIPPQLLDLNCEKAVSVAQRMGVGVFEEEKFSEALESVHAIVLANVDVNTSVPQYNSQLMEFLNESSIPVHCVDAPPGVNLSTGEVSGNVVYAASTVAVGTPLAALHAAREVVGRMYVCDISIPKSLYKIANTDLGQIFTEQPVQQIFPKVE